MKKFLSVFLILAMAMMLFACVKDTPKPKPEDDVLCPILPDLIDYSSEARYYNASKIVYNTDKKSAQEAKLQTKIDSEKVKLNKETSSFTRIFCQSDPAEIIESMSIAGLPELKMIDTVHYITRTDGESAIDDYEEHEKLQDAYDVDASDANSDALQIKRRDIMGKVFAIYLNDADQFARALTQEIIYAQKVVIKMHADNIPSYPDQIPVSEVKSVDDYYRYVLEDYETLSYFKSFNETIVKDNKEITKLYGYYYNYEKKGYDTLTEAEFKEQLTLSHKEVLTKDEALRYTSIRRLNYEKAYRYSSDFYKKFYQAHLTFQGKQEKFDLEVYTISKYNDLSYSTELLTGFNVGMEGQLKLSDVNHLYTGDNNNVIKYNVANTAFNGLSTAEKLQVSNYIKEVELNVEQLRTQYFTMTHKSIAAVDLSAALQYQIKSYSADYIRAIQSNKKDEVILNNELKGLTNGSTDYKAKEEEIGRLLAMRANLLSNYGGANIATQMETATKTNWEGIKTEMKASIDEDYKKVPSVDVKDHFQIKLIKQTCPTPGQSVNGKFHPETTAHVVICEDRVYDTEHNISRLLNNHEAVLRYANSEVKVTFKQTKTPTEYRISDVGVVTHSKDAISKATSFGNFKTVTIKNDASIALGDLNSKVNIDGKIENREGTTNLTFLYSFTFDGWYVDRDFKYKALPSEKYDFDIALYPGYTISKVMKA